MSEPEVTPSLQQLIDRLKPYVSDVPRRGNAVVETTQALREAILDGALMSGDWLREESLTSVFHVSRTPLREAFNRLEEEGLIERLPGSGARVTALKLEDMAVVYQVRGSLESLAAAAAATHGSRASREPLAAANQRMRDAAAQDAPELFNRANLDFHAALKELAGNQYLRRLLGTLEVPIRRFGARTYSPERMQEILAEHDAIVSAVLTGDAAAAGAAAAAHADKARSATLHRFL